MNNISQVTQVMAADMVGKSRATIMRHIKEGKISKGQGGKIDVSELIRFYGNDIKMPEQVQEEKKKAKKANGRAPLDPAAEEQLELEILREKLKHTERLHESETAQMKQQIEMLRNMLDEEREERRKATALLTDQRSQTDRLSRLENEIKSMRGRGLWSLFSGSRNKAA